MNKTTFIQLNRQIGTLKHQSYQPKVETRSISEADQSSPSALSPLAYLADLLDYATTHIKKDGNPLTIMDLEAYFHQPFGQIPMDESVLLEEVAQIRICIEALRLHFDEDTLDNYFFTKEAQYLQDSYELILLKLGTSYEEIQGISSADADIRSRLANRLGLEQTHLNDLWHGEASLTEAWLQQRFGLKDTHEVAFDSEEADFLIWQKEKLEQAAETSFEPDDVDAKEKWLSGHIQRIETQLNKIILETEEQTLPILRQAFLSTQIKARNMGTRLLINCEGVASLRTTRVSQAITTLQELVRMLRSGLLRDTHPELSFDASYFEEEWKWLGTYQSWRAAMMVFLYPENVLNPSLHRETSSVFQSIIKKIRKYHNFSRTDAEEFETAYNDYFEDLLNLRVDATCYSFQGKLFQVGVGKGKPYFSWVESNQQSDWLSVPGFEEHTVHKISALVPQRVEEQEVLFAFVLTAKSLGWEPNSFPPVAKTKYELYIQHYNVSTGNWLEKPIYLSFPGSLEEYPIYGFSYAPEDRIIVEQIKDVQTSPYVIMRGTDNYFLNQINKKGDNWVNENWRNWKSFTDIFPKKIFALFRLENEFHILAYGPILIGSSLQEKTYIGGLFFQPDDRFSTIGDIVLSNTVVQCKMAIQRNTTQGDIQFANHVLWCFMQADSSSNTQIYHIPTNGKNIQAHSAPFDMGVQVNLATHSGLMAGNYAFISASPQLAYSKTTLHNAQSSSYSYLGTFSSSTDPILNSEQLITLIPLDVYKENNIVLSKYALTYLWETHYFLPMQIAQQLQRNRQYIDAKDYFQKIYNYGLPVGERKIFYGLVREEMLNDTFQRTRNWLIDPLNPHAIATTRQNAYTEYTILSIARCLLEEGDAAFTLDTIESLAKARNLYLTVLELLRALEGGRQAEARQVGRNAPAATNLLDLLDKRHKKLQTSRATETSRSGEASDNTASFLEGVMLSILNFDFTIPENPVWTLLKHHAEVQLFKINTGRNIVGDERPVPSVALSALSLRDLFSGSNPRPLSFAPTTFRYAVLIERAKQLANLAQQMESSLLSALEKLDAERLNVLNAQHGLQASKAGIRLQDLRLTEAENGVSLAELQTQKAEIQKNYYQALLDAGLLETEKKALDGLEITKIVETTTSIVGGIAALSNPVTAVGGVTSIFSGISSLFGGGSTNVEIYKTKASYERRAQDWQHQFNVAQQDTQIGKQQERLAQDQVNIVNQERNIANLRFDQAETVAEFLTQKFTNAELYDWMSEVLEGVYSFFLQQATATAQLAAHQLAFERQKPITPIILSDYWKIQEEPYHSTGDESVDRKGLTGSARLIQDIYKLDQFALQTDQRKLQMSKTISLNSLSPVEFQEFRQTGKMSFYTSMEMFDRDFPGHYLRLIKRVRVSVVALVSPIEGIHASLSSLGISRIVQAVDGVYTSNEIRHRPESIALTGTINQTGLFELETTDTSKLFPFESTGVDASWEFQLPKASNISLDYNSIADVLITIDYTALHSDLYKQQIVQKLDQTFSADRAFSFRYDFPDQWYELHHPELVDEEEQLTVHFDVVREDFPSNLSNLKVKHLTLYLPQDEYADLSISLNRQGKVYPHQNRMTVEGITSSRQIGNFVEKWTNMLNVPPEGQWTLSFPNNEAVKQWFKDGRFKDILFVITYEGQLGGY